MVPRGCQSGKPAAEAERNAGAGSSAGRVWFARYWPSSLTRRAKTAICPDDLVTAPGRAIDVEGSGDEAPVYEVGPMSLNGSCDSWSNDFWMVAGITWNGFNCQVSPIDQIVSANQASTAP